MDGNIGDDFDSAWANGSQDLMFNEALDDTMPNDLMKHILDGNYLVSNSQELAPFVDFLNNDNSQSESGYNLEQQIPNNEVVEAVVDTSQLIVDISETPVPFCGDVPSHVNWAGNHNFNIMFDPQIEKTTKSTTWTYSEQLDKLFVLQQKAVDVKFVLGSSPPPGCVIRALPLFTKPEHVNDIVHRCPNHCLPADPTNEGHPAPDHLVRCESKNSVYQRCTQSDRLSVIVPYEAPQAGTNSTVFLYKFMCYSSCVGGLNRRPIQLVFTLEKNGEVLGRRNLKVRICACPGRDRKAEEKRKLTVRSLSRQSSMTKSGTTVESNNFSLKRKRDDELFTVSIRGRENYEVLSKVAEALELASTVGQEKVETVRAERRNRLLGDALVRSLSAKGSTSLLRQPKIEKE